MNYSSKKSDYINLYTSYIKEHYGVLDFIAHIKKGGKGMCQLTAERLRSRFESACCLRGRKTPPNYKVTHLVGENPPVAAVPTAGGLLH